MTLSLIVAVSENGVIGRSGDLPWHLSADLRRFKQLTMGHTIVMGRKTYESIGRPLPGRTSLVLTHDKAYQAEGCRIVSSLDEALRVAADDSERFVIGGQQIYRLALPRADRLYWTQVHAQIDGDTFFPEVDWDDWTMIEDERHPADEKNQFDYSFRVYQRAE
jgi:dihydrofolate reductase